MYVPAITMEFPMKKILLPYVFVSFIVVNTFASTSEFEGNWNVDKVDCTDTGDVKGRIAVTAMPKAFFCENVPSKIVLKFDANLSALVVEYLLTDGLGREYFAPTEHKSFKCPHCTFPWGELNLSDSLISYQEARSEKLGI